jgi:hypothetical protein
MHSHSLPSWSHPNLAKVLALVVSALMVLALMVSALVVLPLVYRLTKLALPETGH